MNRRLPRQDNFVYLTVAVVFFLLASALVHQFFEGSAGGKLIEAAATLTLAGGIWSVRTERHLFRVGVGLTLAVILASVVGIYRGSSGLSPIHLVILLGFFVLTTWAAARQVLFSGRADTNEVVGAVCIYLLLGMIWSVLYLLIEETVPGSFTGLSAAGGTADLTYFSFVSLTTMGFGDITPVLPLARYLAFMEGIVGQFYLAILVASLVGIRVSRGTKIE
jgi:voltage-gated potassium channel